MDIFEPDIDLTSIEFEWDDEKDRYNFEHHGIHFKTAARVFADPDRLTRYDEEHPQEERYDVIGRIQVGNRKKSVWFVVVTIREYTTKDRIRIISARRAEPEEIRSYEYGYDHYE